MALSREDIWDLIDHYPTRSAKLELRSGDAIRLPRVNCLGVGCDRRRRDLLLVPIYDERGFCIERRRILIEDIRDVKLLRKRRFER